MAGQQFAAAQNGAAGVGVRSRKREGAVIYLHISAAIVGIGNRLRTRRHVKLQQGSSGGIDGGRGREQAAAQEHERAARDDQRGGDRGDGAPVGVVPCRPIHGARTVLVDQTGGTVHV